MQAYFEFFGRMTGGFACLPVEFDQWREPMCLAADHGDHEWQAQCAGARERLRCAADTDPYRQRVLQRAGIDGKVVESRPVLSGPGHELVVADLQEEIQFFDKECIVV